MRESREGTNDSPLRPIVGSQLSSVEFVQDYVQLHFDGPCLTAITWPAITAEHRQFFWGTPGYRDALCERIGRLVERAAVIEGNWITLDFDEGSNVSISLRPEDYRGAEAAWFDNGPEDRWVW